MSWKSKKSIWGRGVFRPAGNLSRDGNLIFSADFTSPGPENLPSSMTINSITVDAQDEFRASSILEGDFLLTSEGDGYISGDGFWPNTGLNTGTYLERSNSGATAPSLLPTPWGGLAPGYLDRTTGDGDLGSAWQANDSSVLDILDGYDIVIELVYRNDQGANTPIMTKGGASPRIVWNHQSSSGGIRFSATDDLGTNFDGQSSSTTPAYHWSHVMFFWDRDSAYPGTAAMISNGAYVPRNLSSVTSSMETSDLFRVGGHPTSYGLGIFAHVSFWRKEDWFAGGAQNQTDWQAIYDERHAYLSGLVAQTSEGDSFPLNMTRSTAATTQTYDSDGYAFIHQVEAGMPRYYEKKDADGNIVGGLLLEEQVTNRIDNMTNISILSGDTDVLIADGYDSPDGLRNAFYAVDGDGSSFHHIADFTFYSNPNWHTFSVWIKPINARYLRLGENSGRVYVRYDMQTGTVIAQDGTQTSPSFGIEDRGNGWYYCWFVAYMDVNSSSMQITIGNSPTNFGYLPVEGNDFYYWNPQVTTTPYPVSEIPISGAQVTRNADSIYWDGYQNVNNTDREGKLRVSLLLDGYGGDAGDGYQEIWQINDGGSSSDQIKLSLDANGDSLFSISSAEGDFSDFALDGDDIRDGYVHNITAGWKDDQRKLSGGNTSGTDTGTGTVPNDLDRLGFPASKNILVRSLKVWDASS